VKVRQRTDTFCIPAYASSMPAPDVDGAANNRAQGPRPCALFSNPLGYEKVTS
jgi:hypothetical protein